MVDNLNSVPFSIYQEVLDFILKYYKIDNLLLDPAFNPQLEFKDNFTLYETKKLESFHSKNCLEA